MVSEQSIMLLVSKNIRAYISRNGYIASGVRGRGESQNFVHAPEVFQHALHNCRGAVVAVAVDKVASGKILGPLLGHALRDVVRLQ